MRLRLLQLAIALASLSPATLAAQRVDQPHNQLKLGTVISAQTLDASRSFQHNRDGRFGLFGLLAVYVTVLDTDDSITKIEMICTASIDNNATNFVIQFCTVAGGVCTSDDAKWNKNPGSGTTRWPWRVDVEGYEDIECTFVATGGTVVDTLTVEAVAAVKG